jgi:hypothetical protein
MSFLDTLPSAEHASVEVVIRVRPKNSREKKENVITQVGNGTIYIKHPDTGKRKKYNSDSIYDLDATQADLYDNIGRKVIRNAFQGYNTSVFAYGQTGSGKTFTMMGDPATQGLIPRVCNSLFELQASHGGVRQGECDISYKVEVSYLEIYAERARDLTVPQGKAEPLTVRQHPIHGPYVEGLHRILVSDYSSIERIIRKGNQERHTASTKMNDHSSRSHAILTVLFTQLIKGKTGKTREVVSRINLVDLAGSEHVEASGVTGINFQEACDINKSLAVLGRVIQKLADSRSPKKKTPKKSPKKKSPKGGKSKKSTLKLPKKKSPKPAEHIPFRDSVLTWILKDSLGGNSKTYMITTISPAACNYADTLTTLRYASNAKTIVNTVEVNEDKNAQLINVLRTEISNLRVRLREKSMGPETTETKSIMEEISQRETLMAEREKTWEEKVQESRILNGQIQAQLKAELDRARAEHQEAVDLLEAERALLMGKVDDMKRRVSKAEHGATAVGAEAVLETTMKLQSHYEKRESVLREQFQDKLQAQGVPKEAQHEIVSLRRACMKLESELDEAKDARSTLDRTLMDLKISAVKTQGTINLLKTERDDLQAELDRVQKLLVVAEADATRAAGNLTNDRARFGRQIQQLKAKLTRLEQS